MSDLADWSVDDLLAQATCALLIDGKVKGTAWLVSDEGHLLTAGHLLGMDKPRDEVEVRFAEDVPREAHRIQWGYQQEMGVDFAVLKLASPLPDRHPLPVSLAKSVTGTFRLHGYGKTLKDRSVGAGEFIGLFDPQNSPGNRLFELDSKQLGEAGYSGAAVFSDELQRVVAVQTEATKAIAGPGRDTILAMPLYRIARQWEPLAPLEGETKDKPSTAGTSPSKEVDIRAAFLKMRCGEYDTRYCIQEAVTVIGRAKQCQLEIPDEYDNVERYHATIFYEKDIFTIADGYQNRSTKFGTFVNGVQLKPQTRIPLRDGDCIVLGGFRNKKAQELSRGACEIVFEEGSNT